MTIILKLLSIISFAVIGYSKSFIDTVYDYIDIINGTWLPLMDLPSKLVHMPTLCDYGLAIKFSDDNLVSLLEKCYQSALEQLSFSKCSLECIVHRDFYFFALYAGYSIIVSKIKFSEDFINKSVSVDYFDGLLEGMKMTFESYETSLGNEQKRDFWNYRTTDVWKLCSNVLNIPNVPIGTYPARCFNVEAPKLIRKRKSSDLKIEIPSQPNKEYAPYSDEIVLYFFCNEALLTRIKDSEERWHKEKQFLNKMEKLLSGIGTQHTSINKKLLLDSLEDRLKATSPLPMAQDLLLPSEQIKDYEIVFSPRPGIKLRDPLLPNLEEYQCPTRMNTEPGKKLDLDEGKGSTSDNTGNENNDDEGNSKVLIVVVIVSSIFFLMLVIIIWRCCKRMKSNKRKSTDGQYYNAAAYNFEVENSPYTSQSEDTEDRDSRFNPPSNYVVDDNHHGGSLHHTEGSNSEIDQAQQYPEARGNERFNRETKKKRTKVKGMKKTSNDEPKELYRSKKSGESKHMKTTQAGSKKRLPSGNTPKNTDGAKRIYIITESPASKHECRVSEESSSSGTDDDEIILRKSNISACHSSSNPLNQTYAMDRYGGSPHYEREAVAQYSHVSQYAPPADRRKSDSNLPEENVCSLPSLDKFKSTPRMTLQGALNTISIKTPKSKTSEKQSQTSGTLLEALVRAPEEIGNACQLSFNLNGKDTAIYEERNHKFDHSGQLTFKEEVKYIVNNHKYNQEMDLNFPVKELPPKINNDFDRLERPYFHIETNNRRVTEEQPGNTRKLTSGDTGQEMVEVTKFKSRRKFDLPEAAIELIRYCEEAKLNASKRNKKCNVKYPTDSYIIY